MDRTAGVLVTVYIWPPGSGIHSHGHASMELPSGLYTSLWAKKAFKKAETRRQNGGRNSSNFVRFLNGTSAACFSSKAIKVTSLALDISLIGRKPVTYNLHLPHSWKIEDLWTRKTGNKYNIFTWNCSTLVLKSLAEVIRIPRSAARIPVLKVCTPKTLKHFLDNNSLTINTLHTQKFAILRLHTVHDSHC